MAEASIAFDLEGSGENSDGSGRAHNLKISLLYSVEGLDFNYDDIDWKFEYKSRIVAFSNCLAWLKSYFGTN